MTAVLDPQTVPSPTDRPPASRNDHGRWEVHTAASVASARVGLPLGHTTTARFGEIVGLLDLADPGGGTIALLVGVHSLQTMPARHRRRWLGQHLLDADRHPRLAVVLDDLRPSTGGWDATGRVHVKRRVADIAARVEIDPALRHASVTFGVDRDAVDLVWAQTAGSIHRAIGRRVDVVMDLALTPRARGGRW